MVFIWSVNSRLIIKSLCSLHLVFIGNDRAILCVVFSSCQHGCPHGIGPPGDDSVVTAHQQCLERTRLDMTGFKDCAQCFSLVWVKKMLNLLQRLVELIVGSRGVLQLGGLVPVL